MHSTYIMHALQIDLIRISFTVFGIQCIILWFSGDVYNVMHRVFFCDDATQSDSYNVNTKCQPQSSRESMANGRP
jgi:hypothetical protein